ncbi:MAG: molybdopterin-dependent oxidoreductase, partial [Pararhodobacter sp.]|nr:molybdopterin-dependent oxidoreductase [Pararhodobacter sp.]
MTRRWTNDLIRADVTPKEMFLNRRALLAGIGGAGALGLLGQGAAAQALEPNTLEQISSYNNFYEFGWNKEDPAAHAGDMVISPWSITVDGLVDRPGSYSLAELLEGLTVEERIYRFRCVEAWSMVVPWNGVGLGDVLAKVGVQSGARYVAF